jgi:hypothetical protein
MLAVQPAAVGAVTKVLGPYIVGLD